MSKDYSWRFWSKVAIGDECWEWLAHKVAAGYGQFGVKRKVLYAHRVAYELAVGPIPENKLIDHSCHNKSCVKPTHLRLASKKQNAENMASVIVTNTSGVRGVSWNKKLRKYVTYVTHHGKRLYLGSYHELEVAEAVVVGKRNELYTFNDLDRVIL